MILTLLITLSSGVLFFIISLLSGLLANAPVTIPSEAIDGLSRFLSIANALLPTGFLYALLSCIAFWSFVSMSWAIIEFIYRKLPFLGIR